MPSFSGNTFEACTCTRPPVQNALCVAVAAASYLLRTISDSKVKMTKGGEVFGELNGGIIIEAVARISA